MLVAEPKIPVIAMRGPRVRIHLPPAESRLRTRLLSEFDHLRGSLGNSNTDASIGQHRHQRERAGEIPAVPHNALSAIAVRGRDTSVGAVEIEAHRQGGASPDHLYSRCPSV